MVIQDKIREHSKWLVYTIHALAIGFIFEHEKGMFLSWEVSEYLIIGLLGLSAYTFNLLQKDIRQKTDTVNEQEKKLNMKDKELANVRPQHQQGYPPQQYPQNTATFQPGQKPFDMNYPGDK